MTAGLNHWPGVGRAWSLRSNSIWRGATQERDWRAHGPGRQSRFSGRHGAARSVLASRHWIRDWDFDGDWCRLSHVEPTLRSHPVKSVAADRCDLRSWIGGVRYCNNPRPKSSKHRPNAGTAQRMIYTDQPKPENGIKDRSATKPTVRSMYSKAL